MSQQGDRQASIRIVTGTAEALEGDWHALFDLSSIPAGAFDGRLLAWINLKLEAEYTNLPEAMQALAEANSAYNFASLGTFDASVPGSGAYSPAYIFSVARNSQYAPTLGF